MMSFVRLSSAQGREVRRHIEGCVVHDLGAGDLAGSKALIELGAASVIAVDKQKFVDSAAHPKVRFVRKFFHEYKDAIDVAFVSWPINHEGNGITELLRRARMVIYLGKNTDGSACGSVEMFRSLAMRKVHAYVPDRRNTLIVYGPEPREDSAAVYGEEMAGLTVYDRMWSYDEAEATRPPPAR